jgi:hypothetical protein
VKKEMKNWQYVIVEIKRKISLLRGKGWLSRSGGVVFLFAYKNLSYLSKESHLS